MNSRRCALAHLCAVVSQSASLVVSRGGPHREYGLAGDESTFGGELGDDVEGREDAFGGVDDGRDDGYVTA